MVCRTPLWVIRPRYSVIYISVLAARMPEHWFNRIQFKYKQKLTAKASICVRNSIYFHTVVVGKPCLFSFFPFTPCSYNSAHLIKCAVVAVQVMWESVCVCAIPLWAFVLLTEFKFFFVGRSPDWVGEHFWVLNYKRPRLPCGELCVIVAGLMVVCTWCCECLSSLADFWWACWVQITVNVHLKWH